MLYMMVGVVSDVFSILSCYIVDCQLYIVCCTMYIWALFRASCYVLYVYRVLSMVYGVRCTV